ncbi:TlpA family protein disulfide reductase [Flagellimonas allohymeniacidonis]|uniref:TlpA family protein disulfide reductase n=1 Tax=Flagellimonas allohymeniacidonis TaxID=2517819 RepID=A0A4Q8Q8Y5_9FLAO|nr:TlpA disulfide reductase family protein [Allomuricauda hymeniacidonis]TAI46651.1 TlpA family protein disulfide reductase [Allomuricauda hymeniacidonis]
MIKKLSKDQISNVIWILAIVLILFTPLGFYARVLVGKVFATSANIIEIDNREKLKAYNWKLKDLEGNGISFSDLKGEVVLINFWATWCPPCVAEMPSLNDLYQDYHEKIAFVFVANDQKEKVVSFLDKKQYGFPVFFETLSTPDLLISRSIPATYILSKSGEIVVAEKGAADWNSQSTRELLDQLLQE